MLFKRFLFLCCFFLSANPASTFPLNWSSGWILYSWSTLTIADPHLFLQMTIVCEKEQQEAFWTTHTRRQKRQAIWLCLVGMEQLSTSGGGKLFFKKTLNTPFFMPFKKPGWRETFLLEEGSWHLTSNICSGLYGTKHFVTSLLFS